MARKMPSSPESSRSGPVLLHRFDSPHSLSIFFLEADIFVCA
jgi:hypothetical protein